MKKRVVKVLLSGLILASCAGGGSGPSDIRPAGSESSSVQVFVRRSCYILQNKVMGGFCHNRSAKQINFCGSN